MTQHEPRTTRLWSFTEDVLVEGGEGAEPLTVLTRWGEFAFPAASEAVRESLTRMAMGPVTLDNVQAAADDGFGPSGLADVLETLSGSVVHSLRMDDRLGSVLSVEPTRTTAMLDVGDLPSGRLLRLSRFASFRPVAGALHLEMPRAAFRVVLRQPAAVQIATSLCAPETIAGLASRLRLPEQFVADVARFLVASDAVQGAGDRGDFAEDSDLGLKLWTHHELLFHTQSQSRYAEAEPVLAGTGAPMLRPLPPGRVIDLDVPQHCADPPLSALLESDHSCPDFSTRELAVDQVAELLYRSARVRGPGPDHLPHGMTHEASQRPYLSIACLYELELFVMVDRCSGLERGIYHYDPVGHALTLVRQSEAQLAEVLDTAKIAAGCVRRPAAMLTFAARMDRTAVLGGAAYATTLMHVGALQQTLSLVSAAIGLDAHAVPTEGQPSIDQAIGLEWPAEVVVGHCVLSAPN